MKLLNAQGMTLIEVMVAAGLVAGLAVAGMTLFKTQNVAQKTVEQNYEVTATLGAIRTILADKDNCIRNLRGRNPITLPNVFSNIIKVKNSVDQTPALYPVNSLLPGTSLKITSYQLSKSYPSLGAEETMLVIGFSRGNNVQMDGITKTVKIYYEAATAANAPTPVGMIHNCYAVTSGQSEDLWQVSQVDMNDIYYNSGDVGVGVTDPLTRLHVGGVATISNPLGSNYNENLRLPPGPNDYASIALGSSPTAVTGSVAGQWTFVRHPTAGFNNLFGIRHLNTDFLNITNTGNVGIGTTAPLSKLTVNGNALIGSATALTPNVGTLQVSGSVNVQSNGQGLNIIRNAPEYWQNSPVNDGFFRLQLGNNRDSAGGGGMVQGYVFDSVDECCGAGAATLTSFRSKLGGYYGHAHRAFESEVYYDDRNAFHFIGKYGLGSADTFWVKAGATSDMYVSGNVGIGTNSPGAKLDVMGETRTGTHPSGKYVYFSGNWGSGQTGDGGVEFRHTNATQGIGIGHNTIYQTGTNPNQELNLRAIGTGPITLNAVGGASGNVGIGTTNPQGRLDIAGGRFVLQENPPEACQHWQQYASARTMVFGTFGCGASEKWQFDSAGFGPGRVVIMANGAITAQGIISAPSFVYTSDQRLKKNITPISAPLSTLERFRGVRFSWKESNAKDIGFIAQEVEKIEPSLVHTSDKGIKAVKYGNIIAIVVEAIKEMKQLLMNLGSDQNELKKHMSQVQKENDNLKIQMRAQEERINKQEKLIESILARRSK